MDIKNLEPTLAVGSLSTPHDIEYLRKHPRETKYELFNDCRSLTTLNGLHLAEHSWKSCLGSVTGEVGRPYFYIGFPYQWQTVENIEKWCEVLRTQYNLDVHYVGEAFYNSRVYGLEGYHQIRTHVISINEQKELYKTSAYSILFKVTLLRYLYRTNHYRKIIEPLYEMLDAGLNPWDALLLSHYYAQLFDVKDYANDRGIVYDLKQYGPSLMWPRSFEDLSELFKSCQLINGVWSAKTPKTSFYFAQAPEINALGASFYNTVNKRRFLRTDEIRYFQDPRNSIFIDQLRALFSKKDWKGAAELYMAFVKDYTSLYKLISERPMSFEQYASLGGGTFSLMTGGWFDHNKYNDARKCSVAMCERIYKFLNSL